MGSHRVRLASPRGRALRGAPWPSVVSIPGGPGVGEACVRCHDWSVRRCLPILTAVLIVGAWGAVLRPAPLAPVVASPFQNVQAAEDFACQLRPLTAPKGDRNGEIASSVDRTEFACSYRGTRCRFWAVSIGGHQEYLIAPSDDQTAVIATLTSLLHWPSDLPAAIKRQDSGVLGMSRWHYQSSGYLLIEVADSARVT